MFKPISSLIIVIATTLLIILTSGEGVAAFDFDPKLIPKVTSATLNKFLSTHRPILLCAIADWCGHCRQAAPEIEKFARIMKNVTKVGYIDDKEQALMQRFQVQGFPTMMYWSKSKKAASQQYVGPRTAAGLQSHFVGIINSEYKAQVAAAKADVVARAAKVSSKKAFVLFTDKDKVAPIWSVLQASPVYDGKIAFAVVKTKAKGGKALLEQFGAGGGGAIKAPSMHLFSVSDSDENDFAPNTDEYTGSVDYNSIAKFLNAVASGGELPAQESGGGAGGGADASDNNNNDNQQGEEQEQEEKKPKAPPKRALPVDVIPIDQKVITDFCSGNAIGRKQPFCVVFFSNDESAASVDDVRAYFDQEPLLFFSAFGDDVALAKLGESFPDGAPQTAQAHRALVFRTTKVGGASKYAWIDAQTQGDAKNEIGRIMEGLLRMKKGELPKL